MDKKKEKDLCFMVMPFGGYFDQYYINIYKPAIEESDLLSIRGDNVYMPSTIIKDIWELIQRSTVILADLTGKNANVFYELGLAHASQKPVILIAESMDDVPFDLRAQRIITYNKEDFNWGEKLKNDIKQSLKETLAAPLSAVLPAFLEIEHPEKVSKSTKEFLELKNEIELIKRQVNIKRGIGYDLIKRSQQIKQGKKDINTVDHVIVELWSQGYTMQEIAKTINTDPIEIARIVEKLQMDFNVDSMNDLILKFKRVGLIN